MNEHANDSGDNRLAWVNEPAQETLEAYARARQDAVVVELPGLTEIHFTGADRARFLHNLCTNDVQRLEPGSGCEAFVTNVQGKTIGHGLVFCDSDRLVYLTTPGQADILLPHWDRYLITEDVQLVDRSAELCHWIVLGPESSALVERIVGDAGQVAALTRPLDHRAVAGGASGGQLRSVPMLATQAFLLAGAAGDRADWRARMTAAGAVTAPAEVFQMARLEAAWPWFGWDISDRNLPQEVGRDAQAISFRKGCYLGQETVARIDALGHVNRMLTRLVSSDTLTPCPGTALLLEGQPVGEVTSSAFSPARGKGLALAYVRCSARTPGATLETPDGRRWTIDDSPAAGASAAHAASH